MPNGKFVFSIIGICVVLFAMMKVGDSSNVIEGFWGGTQFTTRAMPLAKMQNGKEVALSGNYLKPPDMMGSGKFVSTPSFQGVLAPRFSNINYGANIKYNMPDRENLASPCDPLTFGNMAHQNYSPNISQENYSPNREQKEEYCGSTSGATPSCGKGGYGIGHKINDTFNIPPDYTNGNWQEVNDNLKTEGFNMGSDLPVGTMSTMDGSGNIDQFIAFNRIMPANTKSSSRLRGQGDYIRGDLAIVPCQSGWFSVYPDISRDLNEGAMNVLAGAGGGGSSYNELMKLIVSASGGAQTTLGGVDLSESLPQYDVNMTGDQITKLTSAMGDINVTAFP